MVEAVPPVAVPVLARPTPTATPTTLLWPPSPVSVFIPRPPSLSFEHPLSSVFWSCSNAGVAVAVAGNEWVLALVLYIIDGRLA